jgi:hypothetical protein
MISLLIYSFAAYGFAFIAGDSKISLPLRTWLDRPGLRRWFLALLECPACLGFHIGWIAFATGHAPHSIVHWWGAALFTTTSNLLLARLSGIFGPA